MTEATYTFVVYLVTVWLVVGLVTVGVMALRDVKALARGKG